MILPIIEAILFYLIRESFSKRFCKTNKFFKNLQCPNDLCSKDTLNWTPTNCYCDVDCAFYGDCCKNIQSTYNVRDKTGFSCVKVNFEYIYIINKCSNPILNSQLQTECEKSINSFYNPFVTNIQTKRTYKNLKCALCNGETLDNVVPWKIKINCELSANNLSSLNEAISKNILKYERNNDKWYLKINNEQKKCSMFFIMDEEIKPSVRYCKNYISNCSSTWKGVAIKRKCKQDTAFRYYNGQIYKNVHCAVCNFITKIDLRCSENFGFSGVLNKDEFFETSAIDTSAIDSCSYACIYTPLEPYKCNEGFVYNDEFRCCITCGPTEEMINNKCVPIL